MADPHPLHPRSGNRLLDMLPVDDYRRLLPLLTPVKLAVKQVLHKARRPVEYAYFPTRGVASALVVMADGAAMEVGNVGSEGVVGAATYLGGRASPHEVFVQVPGDALRIEAAALARESARDGPFRQLLADYQTYFLFHVSLAGACNGLHPVAKRCCRWVLMTHDRAGGDVLPLTHEFLALMLGVRRPSVSVVLEPLQDRKLIKYTRGKVTVLDRAGLEAEACECYRAARVEYDRLLSGLNLLGGHQDGSFTASAYG